MIGQISKERHTLKQKGRRKKSIVREVLGWIICLAVLCAAVYLVVHYVAEQTEVTGESMYPALSDGDHLIVDKISYRFSDPKRFDVVVFPFRYQEDTFYIKRIIGLPGETVQIYDGEIYINGKVLKESFGYGEIKNPGLASEPVTLGEQEYFVLGDNRPGSTDSREPSVGNIARSEIVGKAWFRIWPLDRLGFLKHQ